MTIESLGRRFDELGMRLYACERDLAALKEYLVTDLDKSIVGELVAELDIGWEECIGLAANVRDGCSPTINTMAQTEADQPNVVKFR